VVVTPTIEDKEIEVVVTPTIEDKERMDDSVYMIVIISIDLFII